MVLVDIDQLECILVFYLIVFCEIVFLLGVIVWRNYLYFVFFLRMVWLVIYWSVQGQGFGELVLFFVIDDVVIIFCIFIVIGGLVVDVKDQQVVVFYEKYEFIRIEENGFQFFLFICDCILFMEMQREVDVGGLLDWFFKVGSGCWLLLLRGGGGFLLLGGEGDVDCVVQCVGVDGIECYDQVGLVQYFVGYIEGYQVGVEVEQYQQCLVGGYVVFY